jgi:hypothetical protein
MTTTSERRRRATTDVMTEHRPYSSSISSIDLAESRGLERFTPDELRSIEGALRRPRPDRLALTSIFVSSMLLVGTCLYRMRSPLDLAFLFLGLAILAYWCVLAWLAVERERLRRRALRIVRRWGGGRDV